jgi:hypothetical protein
MALKDLGDLLELQMPMSMVKDVWQSLSGQNKPGQNVDLDTMSHISAMVGSWVVQWNGHRRTRVFAGRAAGISVLDTVLQGSQ